ncbi:MAG: AbrB/MazE/SpoVT family DNA-binding domain-containing protein [Candidatus Woesearchaeota archaeon]
MKKYPKIVQCDSRGQIVIPKDIRRELQIDEWTGFFMYSIQGEGILLKKIAAEELAVHKEMLQEIKDKAATLGIKNENIDIAIKNYKKTKEGNLEVL